ncbi:MAG: hypothetical protein LH615_05270, partial [Ferruginibacter sp.]|nr:hypothetical protein [Ferruginibacter sp.]
MVKRPTAATRRRFSGENTSEGKRPTTATGVVLSEENQRRQRRTSFKLQMQTQQKVTYLLGAGASAMALPTYENFKERFLKFKNALRNANIESGNPRVVVNSIITDATNFYNELDYHSTPDTVAKKYFISEQKDKLYGLKVILVIFFFFEQTRKSKEKNGDGHEEEIARFEKRYDNFISRLL